MEDSGDKHVEDIAETREEELADDTEERTNEEISEIWREGIFVTPMEEKQIKDNKENLKNEYSVKEKRSVGRDDSMKVVEKGSEEERENKEQEDSIEEENADKEDFVEEKRESKKKETEMIMKVKVNIEMENSLETIKEKGIGEKEKIEQQNSVEAAIKEKNEEDRENTREHVKNAENIEKEKFLENIEKENEEHAENFETITEERLSEFTIEKGCNREQDFIQKRKNNNCTVIISGKGDEKHDKDVRNEWLNCNSTTACNDKEQSKEKDEETKISSVTNLDGEDKADDNNNVRYVRVRGSGLKVNKKETHLTQTAILENKARRKKKTTDKKFTRKANVRIRGKKEDETKLSEMEAREYEYNKDKDVSHEKVKMKQDESKQKLKFVEKNKERKQDQTENDVQLRKLEIMEHKNEFQDREERQKVKDVVPKRHQTSQRKCNKKSFSESYSNTITPKTEIRSNKTYNRKERLSTSAKRRNLYYDSTSENDSSQMEDSPGKKQDLDTEWDPSQGKELDEKKIWGKKRRSRVSYSQNCSLDSSPSSHSSRTTRRSYNLKNEGSRAKRCRQSLEITDVKSKNEVAPLL